MASNYDATEFIDGDFETHKTAQSVASPGAKSSQRASDEAEAELTKLLQQREEMKREQEELHRKIAAREETRRRQIECRAGRQEMVQNLIRGVGLLEEAEFNARRDAEQMAKALVELRYALSKVEVIQEETWAADKLDAELTRALTAIENARLEWNSARLKFPLLSGEPAPGTSSQPAQPPVRPWTELGFGQLCRLGLALTWPLAIVAILGAAALLALVLRHR
jgi:chromosome segregation ATPase